MRALAIIALGTSLATMGCSKKDDAQVPASENSVAVSTSSAVEPPQGKDADSAQQDDDLGVLVPADMEQKAEEEISAANLEQQLDELEKEIGK